MNLIALALIGVGGIILTIGDLFMKEWVITDKSILYISGILIYLMGLNFLAFSFKYKNIAVATILFMLFNVLTLIIFSYFYFHEKLSGMEIAEVLLGIAAIVMLELADK